MEKSKNYLELYLPPTKETVDRGRIDDITRPKIIEENEAGPGGPIHTHKAETENEINTGASSSRMNPSLQKTMPVSMNASAGRIRWKTGSITEATEDYIIHQCNCVQDTPAKGAAAHIFNEFEEADVYQERYYSKKTIDAPGAISIHGRVINIYGQFLPGKPQDDRDSKYWKGQQRYITPELAATDTRKQRVEWFEECMNQIMKQLPPNKAHSVAFPKNIGCALGGGNWNGYPRKGKQKEPSYLEMIQNFAEKIQIGRLQYMNYRETLKKSGIS